MTEHTDGHDAGHRVDYFKIYLTLLVLLGVSVAGPFLEIFWVTLVTAFGVAVVKATLVIQNFMHLRWEKAIMKWMLATSLVLVGLFFFGVAPDVMRHEGSRWVNVAAMDAVARGIPTAEHGEDADRAAEADHGEAGPSEGGGAPAPAAPAAAFSAERAYQTTCALCHGATGRGDGPGGAALDPAPADFTDPALWARAGIEEEMFQVIKDGGPAAGRSPLMAAWGSLYSDEEILRIVAYLRGSFAP